MDGECAGNPFKNIAHGANTDHGSESSFELLVKLNPDFIFVCDRDSAISRPGARTGDGGVAVADEDEVRIELDEKLERGLAAVVGVGAVGDVFERIPRAFPIHVAHMGGGKRG